MAKKLSGLHPLAYMGVNASTPPNLVEDDRAPTSSDYSNFPIGTIWLWKGTTNRVYMLANKSGGSASWVQFDTSGSGGLEKLKADDLNDAIADSSKTIRIKGGSNITTSITGASELTITSSGGFTWNDVTTTSVSMVADNGYICRNVALTTATLPATCSQGALFKVTSVGVGSWKIAQNATQQIHLGTSSTTAGTGGYLQGTNQRDSIEIVCVVADTHFNVLSSIGNITVV